MYIYIYIPTESPPSLKETGWRCTGTATRPGRLCVLEGVAWSRGLLRATPRNPIGIVQPTVKPTVLTTVGCGGPLAHRSQVACSGGFGMVKSASL